MKSYARSHLSDQTLLHDLATRVARDRSNTAELLADLAEVDVRKLYVPAAYQSLYAYCVGELRLSEEAAYKRIHAARAARRFPAIFEAVAEGRLHLSAVIMLAPHLTEDTAGELLAAAAHKSKPEIERLLAERFPRPDLPARVQPIAPPSPALCADQHAPGRVGENQQASPGNAGDVTQHAPGRVEQATEPAKPPLAPTPIEHRSRVEPLAPGRYGVQFTIGQSGHDKLRYAQELLGHQIPAGDIAQLFERALDALIPQLEKQRFAATSNPHPSRRRASSNPRYVPADIQRAVWERDQGQCTFESETGRRCQARADLEFDHVQEVARGGEASVNGIRLRCRAHNQYQAECTFGTEFMRHKRIAAAEARAAASVGLRNEPG